MDKDFLTVVKKISEILLKNDLKLSIAESCTGGFISNAITNLPGSSRFFGMSVISYSKESKVSVLGISHHKLKKYGVISEETAVAMAKSVKKIADADVSLSVTGITGPETMEDREVGLVYMAVEFRDLAESKGMKFSGNREEIKRQASLEALKFLNQVLRTWI